MFAEAYDATMAGLELQTPYETGLDEEKVKALQVGGALLHAGPPLYVGRTISACRAMESTSYKAAARACEYRCY